MGDSGGGRPASISLWPIVAATAVLLVCALLSPWNHDEGQYVAASALVARGLIPFRDFAYLQTPLQPFLLAPLEWLAPGWLYLASRVANALFVTVGLALIGKTAAVLAGDRRAGIAAILLGLVTDSLLFAGSVARNDALPFLLLALSLERLYGREGAVGRGRAFVAGLAVAAAASTKISYAFPAAAMAVQALWHMRRGNAARALAFLAGCAVGSAPTAILLALAPDQFLFGVYRYSIDAVAAWQHLVGKAYKLGWLSRFGRIAVFMVQGPLLALGIAAIWFAFRKQRRPIADPAPMGIRLGPVVLLTLACVVLPMPPYRQYIVPLVAPLLLWLARHGWPTVSAFATDRRRIIRFSFAAILVAGAGIGRTVQDIRKADHRERPFAVEADAHRLRALLGERLDGPVAGLEPIRLIDSGLPFDPRFATGPFLFRAGNLADCRDGSLCPVTFATMDHLLQSPPGAIVLGDEGELPPRFPGGLDGQLGRWAIGHGYRRVSTVVLASPGTATRMSR